MGGRPANIGGSWEPSSKKEYGLQQNISKIHALFVNKITDWELIMYYFLWLRNPLFKLHN